MTTLCSGLRARHGAGPQEALSPTCPTPTEPTTPYLVLESAEPPPPPLLIRSLPDCGVPRNRLGIVFAHAEPRRRRASRSTRAGSRAAQGPCAPFSLDRILDGSEPRRYRHRIRTPSPRWDGRNDADHFRWPRASVCLRCRHRRRDLARALPGGASRDYGNRSRKIFVPPGAISTPSTRCCLSRGRYNHGYRNRRNLPRRPACSDLLDRSFA